MPEIIITLKKAITVGGSDQITELALREPTLKDHQAFEAVKVGEDGPQMSMGDMMETALLAAQRLGNLTPGEAGDICLQDGVAIFTEISTFFGEGEG